MFGWFRKKYKFKLLKEDMFNYIMREEHEDRNYKYGSLDFIKSEILPYCYKNRAFKYDYDSNKSDNKLDEIKNSGWDCDDFAHEFLYHARKKAWGDYSINLPVCLVKYRKDDGGLHMINAIMTTDDFIVYVEPQTCKIIQLTDKEKSKILYHRF